MKDVRSLISIPAALLLAAAIHVDWHFARHHARLSLGWSQHWLVALPIFGAAAWYLCRRRSAHLLPTSVATIAAGVILGQGIEPLGEVFLHDASFSQVFGPERMRAFAVFMVAGLVAYIATLWALRARSLGPPDAPPTA